jgi:nicotinamide riboside kinase
MTIVITGPESTGKTTLAKQLSNHFGLPWLPEQSRVYLEKNGPRYELADLIHIAEIQKAKEAEWMARYPRHILDTDLLTLQIWSQVKYGRIPKELENQHYEFNDRYYLLLYADLPWEYDDLRENPNNHHQLFNLYEKHLENQRFHYGIIKGVGKKRLNEAIIKMNEIIG